MPGQTRGKLNLWSGPERLIFAFDAVIIGGLGSLLGHAVRWHRSRCFSGYGCSLLSDWILPGHIALLIILVVRRQGLYRMRGNWMVNRRSLSTKPRATRVPHQSGGSGHPTVATHCQDPENRRQNT